MDSRIEIDLRAMDANVRTLRAIIDGDAQGKSTRTDSSPPAIHASGPVKLCAVLKQDGYGCGGPRIAKFITRPGAGVDMVAVYSIDEARALVESAINVPILILAPVRVIERTDPVYRALADERLHLTVHDPDHLRTLGTLGSRLGVRLPIHIHVDTGMSRGGSSPAGATAILDLLHGGSVSRRAFRVAGLMTHFSNPCVDADVTSAQARRFRAWVSEIQGVLAAIQPAQSAGANGGGGVLVHAANTCATLRSASLHGSMVRVGQALFGYTGTEPKAAGSAGQFQFAAMSQQLEPAVRWTSSIVHTQEIEPGWPVGYGSLWTAPTRPDGKNTRIALVPVGYADGYPRSAANAFVGLTGRHWERPAGADKAEPPAIGVFQAPIVGRISMDQMTIDVTDLPESAWAIGAEVEMYGRARHAANYLPAVAAAADTITHDLLCRMNPRIERIYRFPPDHESEGTRGVSSASPGQSPHAGPVLKRASTGRHTMSIAHQSSP